MRIVALGCAKNKVDSEHLAGDFAEKGWKIVAGGAADCVVVTTCAFIEDASQESVNVLLEEIATKKRGETKCLVAAGCLPQRYKRDLAEELKDLDIVVGVGEFGDLPGMVNQWFGESGAAPCFAVGKPRPYAGGPRLLLGPPWQAWLKISDGCNRACSFCTIPGIRGPWRSAPIPELIDEAEKLAEAGVVELSLTAQDTTAYGFDLDATQRLPGLLTKLDGVRGLRWIRLMYAHPFGVSDELIETVAGCEKVLPYLDLPMQHASGRMLKIMNRKIDAGSQRRLVEKLRAKIPGLVLRTTFLVGHPGETEEDFAELLDFARQARIENVGAFVYSREEGAKSAKMPDQIPREVAVQRLDRLMTMQQEISAEALADRRGREGQILVEEELPEGEDLRYTHSGRASFQAPEVDGITYLHAPEGSGVEPGRIVRARFSDSTEYDLFAEADK